MWWVLEKRWAQRTSCQAKDRAPMWFMFLGLGCHPERHQLLLGLCFRTRGWSRRAAVALCPAWGGGGNGPRVTWPQSFGSGVVFLFVRRVTGVCHQTCLQSFHCGLWKKNGENKHKKEGRGGTVGVGWEKHWERGEKPTTAVATFQIRHYSKHTWEKQTVNRFKFLSRVEEGAAIQAAIGWWGATALWPSNRGAGQRHRTSHAPPPISIQHRPRDTWKRRKTQKKRKNTKTRDSR